MSENRINAQAGPRLSNLAPTPHLDQWFGWWHYEPQRAAAMFDLMRRTDVASHVAAWQKGRGDGSANQYDYTVAGGVAMLELGGSLMKHLSSMDNGTSTVMARQTVRAMKADEAVKAAVIVAESPGGTVAGAYELADDIKDLASAKPTYGYAADIACSAAYLQLAMCRTISANRTALVGCIGTLGVMYDTSEMFKQDGIKPIVVSSGGFKGAGAPGTVITDKQIAEWQREIDALNEHFITAVMAGRRMSRAQVSALADGRTHVGEQARQLGLVDRIESLDQLLSRVRGEIGRPTPTATPRASGGSATASRETIDTEGSRKDAIAAFESEIDVWEQKFPGGGRRNAAAKAQKARPDLHREYVYACNPGARERGLLD